MDLRFSPEDEAFRQEVRSFIRDNLPEDIRRHALLGHPPTKDHQRRWMQILNTKGGWSVPPWKKEWGGPGWTPVQRLIFMEENYAAPAPEPLSFNANMIGPVIGTFGTEQQKAFFLPKLANCDIWFCQGFSEPGAGSDLASLRTAAKRDGDHYVVNGQKIWTSTAHHADWIFALVRTNPSAPKRQEGISMLLMDLKTPGITVRPIISIDRRHHLNEVFFDEVKVPVENLIGVENKGWDYAKFLLSNERVGIARVGKSAERLRFARAQAKEIMAGAGTMADDRSFQERLAIAEVELKATEITQLRLLAAAEKRTDNKPDPMSSILKLKGSEVWQMASELLMELAGPLAAAAIPPPKADAAPTNEPEVTPDWATAVSPIYFNSRAATIYGGSSEVQKNIAAKAIFGL